MYCDGNRGCVGMSYVWDGDWGMCQRETGGSAGMRGGMGLAPGWGPEDAAGWGRGSPGEAGVETGECPGCTGKRTPGKGHAQQTLGNAPGMHGGHWEVLGDLGSAEGRGTGRGRARVGALGEDWCGYWGSLQPRLPPLCVEAGGHRRQEEGSAPPPPPPSHPSLSLGWRTRRRSVRMPRRAWCCSAR